MTNIFATKDTTQEDVDRLVTAALPLMSADGDINWKLMPEDARPFNVNSGGCPIGYSRAWLIVRRAFLEANAPKLIVTLPAEGGDREKTNREWSKVITPLRDDQNLSWGEVAVRVGKPESKVRACYKATGAKKDLGLRIGKGGRFAYDDPEFYLEHRKQEGAMIPSDRKGKPSVEELINAKDAKGKLVAAQRATAKAQERREERAKRTKAPAKKKAAAKSKAS